MIQRASSVGELASRLLSRGRPGVVTRVFERSAYVKTGGDFFLLLWGKTRSPMTINLAGKRDGSGSLKVGEKCELGRSGVQAAGICIAAKVARIYHSSLLVNHKVALLKDEDLLKGAAVLKSLYDSSPHGPTLITDPAFRDFGNDVLVPYAEGKPGRAPAFGDFVGLVGRGGGFTPAGDDFVAGYTATFNYIGRSMGLRPITVPRSDAAERTVPESAAIMLYSSWGYVDEGLERLILDSTSGRQARYLDDLMSMASRGHTSGLDMSTGVLLAEACISDITRGGKAVQMCLRALWAD